MASQNRALKQTISGHPNQTTAQCELLYDALYLWEAWYSLFMRPRPSFTLRPQWSGFPQKEEKRA